MKVIIPVAGVGTRLKPHTHTVPKVLLQVAGKPILGHILDEFKDLSITEVILVVGYLGERIVGYVRGNYSLRVNCIEQKDRLGLGHAIWMTREFISLKEPLLIVLGDTIFKTDLSSVIYGDKSLIGVKEVDDPKRFGIVETENGWLKRVVEKPAKPSSNLAITGIYYITNPSLLFECLSNIIEGEIKVKGEYQLTDALQLMIEKGERIGIFHVDGWYDCGKVETLLATNRELLKMSKRLYDVKGSLVIPPVFIADSDKIENSIIGPYVSIAGGTTIRRSIVRDSIINENAFVEEVLLNNSIIGDSAVVRGRHKKLNVGDSSEVDLA